MVRIKILRNSRKIKNLFILLSPIITCIKYRCILPLSLKASTLRIRVSQTFLTLTNFIEKSINIYHIK